MTIFKRTNITRVKNLDLTGTLFSGQTFSWNFIDGLPGYTCRIINNSPVLLCQNERSAIEVLTTSASIAGSSIDAYFRHYLSLDIDTESIFSEQFRAEYPDIWKSVIPHLGVHVMRQEPFETMVTFMCAQGIGMHLIRRQVDRICRHYGQRFDVDFDGIPLEIHAFPSPAALASAKPDELAACTNNNRLRAGNIIAMARSWESGAIIRACIAARSCPVDELQSLLCLHGGIGMKIADCIALFGFGRFDAFPIDTHVKQYLSAWFGIESAKGNLTGRTYRYLQEQAASILGRDLAGYAGHILFHAWRKDVRNMKAY